MMGESLSNVKFKGDFLLCDGYILYICVEYNINIGNLKGDIIVLFLLYLYILEICIG